MHWNMFVIALLFLTSPAQAQQVTVEVWNLVNQGVPPVPSSTAKVYLSRAANLPIQPMIPLQPPPPSGLRSNAYSLNPPNTIPLADIKVDDLNCHPWAVRDLLLDQGQNQTLVVQLFRLDYPIKAPQCFALKTEYERLLRDEQQIVLEQQMRRPNPQLEQYDLLKLAQKRARMRYADGLLALPNPSRRDKQPVWVRQMLDEMEREQELQPSQYDIDELEKMVDGLFNQYNMNGFEQMVPSIWQTTYDSPNGPVESEVRLYGTYGTYSTSDGQQHILERMDMVYEEDNNGEGGLVVSGRWRFQANERGGRFRWRIGDNQDRFQGTWQFDQDNKLHNWEGRRRQVEYDGSLFPPPPGTVEIPPPAR